MNVTFDTNIFVSGFTQTEGRASQALAKVRTGSDTLFISQYIVGELLRVLAEKFLWSDEQLQSVRQWLTRYGHLVTPPQTLNILADEPDNRILECALSADADVIVTGDRAMLALGHIDNTRIVSLADYLTGVDDTSITS